MFNSKNTAGTDLQSAPVATKEIGEGNSCGCAESWGGVCNIFNQSCEIIVVSDDETILSNEGENKSMSSRDNRCCNQCLGDRGDQNSFDRKAKSEFLEGRADDDVIFTIDKPYIQECLIGTSEKIKPMTVTESLGDTSSLCDASTTGTDSPDSTNNFDATIGDDVYQTLIDPRISNKLLHNYEISYESNDSLLTCKGTSSIPAQDSDIEVCLPIKDDQYVVKCHADVSEVWNEIDVDWDDIQIVSPAPQRYNKRRRVDGPQYIARSKNNNSIDISCSRANPECCTEVPKTTSSCNSGLYANPDEPPNEVTAENKNAIIGSDTKTGLPLPVCTPRAGHRDSLLCKINIVRCAATKFLRQIVLEADTSDGEYSSAYQFEVGEQRCLKTSEYGKTHHMLPCVYPKPVNLRVTQEPTATKPTTGRSTFIKPRVRRRDEPQVGKHTHKILNGDFPVRFVYSPTLSPVNDCDVVCTDLNLGNEVVDEGNKYLTRAIPALPCMTTNDIVRSRADSSDSIPQLSPRTKRRRERDYLRKQRCENPSMNALEETLNKSSRVSVTSDDLMPSTASVQTIQASPWMSLSQTRLSLANWNVVDPWNGVNTAADNQQNLAQTSLCQNQFDKVFKIYSKSDLSGYAGNSPRTHGFWTGDNVSKSNISLINRPNAAGVTQNSSSCELSITTYTWNSRSGLVGNSMGKTCNAIQVNSKHLLASRLIAGLRAGWQNLIISSDPKTKPPHYKAVESRESFHNLNIGKTLWQLSDLIAKCKCKELQQQGMRFETTIRACLAEDSDALCCFLKENWNVATGDTAIPKTELSLLENGLTWGSSLLDFVPRTKAEIEWHDTQQLKSCFLRVLFVDNRTLSLLQKKGLRVELLRHWAMHIFATAFKILLERANREEDDDVICLGVDGKTEVPCDDGDISLAATLYISSAATLFMSNTVFHTVLCCLFPFNKCWGSGGEVSGYSLSLGNFLTATKHAG